MNQKIYDLSNLMCIFIPHSFLPLTAKMLTSIKSLDPKTFFANFIPFTNQPFPKQHIIMPEITNCRKDCVNHILLVQALARRSHFLNVINELNTLLTLQNMIGEGMPGWSKLNEESTNNNISNHTMAYFKANKNVKQLKAILENGCVTCQIDLHEVVQIEEKIASITEEAVQNFLDGEAVKEVLDDLKDLK